jgi:hypothetical protein
MLIRVGCVIQSSRGQWTAASTPMCFLPFSVFAWFTHSNADYIYLPNSMSIESSTQQGTRKLLLPGSRPQLYTRAPSSVQLESQPSENRSNGLEQSCLIPIWGSHSKAKQSPYFSLPSGGSCNLEFLCNCLREWKKWGSRVWDTSLGGKGRTFQ